MGPVSIGGEVQRNTDGDTPSSESVKRSGGWIDTQAFIIYVCPGEFRDRAFEV